MPKSPPVRRAATGLLERLQFAADLHDACHLLLEYVLQSVATERAAVVVRADGNFRGTGYGVPDELLRSYFQRHGRSVNRLSDLIDHGDVAILGDGELSDLTFPVRTLLPFPGPRGIPSGALLLEGAHPTPGEVLDLIETGGPTLARIADAEALQERLTRVERHSSLL